MTSIQRLNACENGFDEQLRALLSVSDENTDNVRSAVRDIIEKVRAGGDRAVLELTRQFDRVEAADMSELEVSKGAMEDAAGRISGLVSEALESSVRRVRKYHEEQHRALGGPGNWEFEDDDGNRLGQVARAMERVGIYAPGGKASYPSSVVMTAIPARVAGVEELILTVPAPDGAISDVLLAAAHLCGVDRLFTIGGAQAIAALAYGTETIARVDKIVGPGNVYVATAKEMVFGDVGIDMIAGPSEVVIVADDSADPDWLVMDLFAQAEHDEMAQSILISTEPALLDAVAGKIDARLEDMPRAGIIRRAIGGRGALIEVPDLARAADIVNRIAPEHLELTVADAEGLLARIRHAGAIFLGNYSAEVVGDYSAGPSHVLPTSGSARFSSPLGVYDFQVRSSLIRCSRRGSVNLARHAAILAREEGLEAHAQSADYRVQG